MKYPQTPPSSLASWKQYDRSKLEMSSNSAMETLYPDLVVLSSDKRMAFAGSETAVLTAKLTNFKDETGFGMHQWVNSA
jgi:hypothetical protein